MKYSEFINSKLKAKLPEGIPSDFYILTDKLFDYQRLIVNVALQKGRFLIGAECGLGKTLMQLEWSRIVSEYTNKPVLIVAPLGVAKQTAKEEGPKFGYKVKICRNQTDVAPGINITNYEMIEHFDGDYFGGVVLDESSILKNFTGTTRNLLKNIFRNTEYKLCCSATPAPNEFMELLNQADFLGIQETAKALANYFINDFKTGQWRLKGHATDAFWQWVCSWAVMISKPSDIGFCDDDYELSKLIENTHLIEVDLMNVDDPTLGIFRNIELSATSYHHEKKITAVDRVKKVKELVDSTNEQFIVWCETNYEADLLKMALNGALEVRGTHSSDYKEKAIDGFKTGQIRVLISKPSIFGFGMNFQNCHRAIFCGLSYSYEDYYQAVKRIHRFGQKSDVSIDIVLGTTEQRILETVEAKAAKQVEIKNQMRNSIKDIQIEALKLSTKVYDFKENLAIEIPTWL